MTLSFSNDGPDFPDEFVDAILGGEVVFLCGTGVSAPQMPGFRSLVERTYEALSVEKTESEQRAFAEDRYEEVLGSLSRRLSDPYAVTRKVSEILRVPEKPILHQHCTILRLSRDLDNRISVVTTNFDTLLERAAADMLGETPTIGSFAGQALPAPGSPSFAGIIHIHGLLRDHKLDLEQTPLVLTSADYGDAYLRSGWASRFLFDLARCKAIILVGYSAKDAPVRYFLNVLEADRARFPDLKPVYAFDSYERDPEEAILPWGTLAVVALPYSKINRDSGKHDHSPLWRDLAELAEIVDRPKRSRRERARTILERPFAEAAVDSRNELGWLFGGRRDLWSVTLDAITDPEWFEFFQDSGLWSVEDASWVIANWVSQDFQDRDRFECACEWQRRLKRPFTDHIEQRMVRDQGLDKTWTRIWRLFCLVEPTQDDERTYYVTKRLLTGGVVLYSDLRKAVGLLAPRLVLSENYHESREKNGSQPIQRIADVVWPRMTISNRHSAEDLVGTLCSMPDRARQILDLATAELRSALELQVELDLIGVESDSNDFTVPSIEHHAQNQFREGVIFLVQLLAESFCQAAVMDRDYTRRIVIGWKSLSGRIGLRLCLHAMRNVELFDADEAMSALLSTSDIDFWTIRREVALLLRDRAETATPEILSCVEERILQTSKAYFDRYPIEPGQTDWRSYARDTAVWLRLHMLQNAGVLSENGTKELANIKVRREYLNRTVEDRDFFGAYSSGVRRIVGDPAPILEAAEDDRLTVAQKLIESPEMDLRQGWSAYCRTDPQGAFDLLRRDKFNPENGVLWNKFLIGLAVGDEASKPIRDGLVPKVFLHLSGFSQDLLLPMASSLANLIYFAPRQDIVGVVSWLERIWQIVGEQPTEPIDLSTDIYEVAIDSDAGKVTEALLYEVDVKRKVGTTPSPSQFGLIRNISVYPGTAGQLGRAILARNLSFLLAVDQQTVIEILEPRINAENAEGVALRAVLLRHGPISPELTHILGPAITRGAIESEQADHAAAPIAAKVLRPAMAEVRGDTSVNWGISASEIANVLRKSQRCIRSGALEVLASWLHGGKSSVEENWRLGVRIVLEDYWPKELEFRDSSLTSRWIDILIGAGDEFPAALEQLRPYIAPYDQRYGTLHTIESSKIPEKFPRQTLSLLWLVCGPGSRGSFFEISKIIDRLIDAEPELEVDRRLQWLETHTTRFD